MSDPLDFAGNILQRPTHPGSRNGAEMNMDYPEGGIRTVGMGDKQKQFAIVPVNGTSLSADDKDLLLAEAEYLDKQTTWTAGIALKLSSFITRHDYYIG